MTRFLKILLAAALLFTMCFSCLCVSAKETVGTFGFAVDCAESVTIGETFDVTVKAAKNDGIIALRFSVEYDESVLTLNNITDKNLFEDAVLSDSGSAPFTYVWANGTAGENNTSTGAIVTLSFKVKNIDKATETVIKVKTAGANDVLDKDLNAVAIEGATHTINVVASSDLAGKSKFIAVSSREESGSGANYVSAGIRFRNRITAELRESATEIGFVAVPTKELNGMTVAEYIETDNNVAMTARALGSGMDEVIYAVSVGDDGVKYYDYQMKIKGLTRQGYEQNLLDLEITVVLYVVVDGERLYSDTVSYSYESIVALQK